MDAQTLETLKLIAAMLGTFFSAFIVSRRQVKKVREEHKTREKVKDAEYSKKEKETEDRFLKQQSAIDDRQAQVVAQVLILAEQWKNALLDEQKRADKLEAALEASRETAEERARMIKAFERQTQILAEMHAWDLGSIDRHKTYVNDVAATLTGQLAVQLAPLQRGTNTMSDDMKQLKQRLDERAEANGEAFKNLQTGLNNLKLEVMQLVKATGQEHEKTRKDLLEKIDALTRIVSDMAKPVPVPAPQVAEKSTSHSQNSAHDENLGHAKEGGKELPASFAPKEGI